MRKNHNSLGDAAFYTVTYFLFGSFALICLFPFYYVIINTISDNQLVASGRVFFWPVGFHLDNYTKVFQLRGLMNSALVSVSRTVLGTAAQLLSASFIGYCMTKSIFWRRKLWYRFIIVTMYFNAGVIPWYLTMHTLRLTNNFWAYVLPSLVSSFNMILVKTYMESLPDSLEESAEIDGAGFLRRFLHIVLPLSTPILATIAIFSAVGQWNSFTDTLFLMSDERYYTLQFMLYKYLNEAQSLAKLLMDDRTNMENAMASLSPVAVRYTVSVVTVLPVLCVYPFFQRFFVKGIMIGAVKG